MHKIGIDGLEKVLDELEWWTDALAKARAQGEEAAAARARGDRAVAEAA
jgi:hypothetical protein